MKKSVVKKWDEININGYDVTIARNEGREVGQVWFCSYVTIKHSQYLDDSILCYPTFRDGDEFGYDTNHSYNDKQSEAEKLSDALRQAQDGIKEALKVIRVED